MLLPEQINVSVCPVKSAFLKERPGFRHETSMQQQDDTVDADKDGTNTDLLEYCQFSSFFQEHFPASSFFVHQQTEFSSDSQVQTMAKSTGSKVIELS